jgi:hypothetical protein
MFLAANQYVFGSKLGCFFAANQYVFGSKPVCFWQQTSMFLAAN